MFERKIQDGERTKRRQKGYVNWKDVHFGESVKTQKPAFADLELQEIFRST